MANESQHFGKSSVVVIGAKPNAALPDVKAYAVVTANNAVELGLLYRKKYGSKIIAMTSSNVLRDRKDVQSAMVNSRPDEIVLLGADLENPEDFVKNKLGLLDTEIINISPQERNNLMFKNFGWRAIFLTMHIIIMRGIKNFIRYVIPDIFGKRTMSFLNRTTGLNAILYAKIRFVNSKEIIIAGISPKAGGHWKGPGGLDEKDAKADRITIRYWSDNKKGGLYTTDDIMNNFTNIPKWKGKVFYYDN